LVAWPLISVVFKPFGDRTLFARIDRSDIGRAGHDRDFVVDDSPGRFRRDVVKALADARNFLR